MQPGHSIASKRNNRASDEAVKPGSCRAFTLIEMSMVIAIVAAVLAMTVSMGDSMVESARRVNTWNKMDAIEDALQAFRLANNRLPCPGDLTLTDIPANSATFGVEAGTLSGSTWTPDYGSCTTGTDTVKANYSASITNNTNIPSGTTVAEGAVPVRTLNLPNEFQWDGWGRKFGYAVWTPLTAVNSFLTYGASPSCGGITVENAGHGYRSTAAAYALISYGQNGHGGYTKSGTRYFAGSDNADEWTDCHCNATADTGYKASYVEERSTQSNPADSKSVYDDYVTFKERWQMMDAYDTYVPTGAFCTPGFRIDGVYANGALGAGSMGNGWTTTGLSVADVNGDGIQDLIISGYNASTGKYDLYIIFGTASPLSPDPFPISSINGANGVAITGFPCAVYNNIAFGDFNADGITDMLIQSSCGLDGYAYVVFGQASAWPASINVSALSATSNPKGIQFTNDIGSASIAAGDVNGAKNGSTTIDDIIIDAFYGRSGALGQYPGMAFVVFGNTNIASIPTNLTTLNGTNGFTVTDVHDTMGYLPGQVATGDYNGDGIKDIWFGIPNASSCSSCGYAAILWGGASLSPTATAATGTITFASNPSNNQYIYIGGTASADKWKFVTSGATGAETNIGANLAATLSSLATNLNASSTSPFNSATYSASSTALTVTYITAGGAGNSFAIGKGTAGSNPANGTDLTGGGANRDLSSTSATNGLPANGSAGLQIGSGGFDVNTGNTWPFGGWAISGFTIDMNGDGIDDIAIPYQDGFLLAFGTKSWPASNYFDTSTINGSNGAWLPTASGWLGPQATVVADVTGDGKLDLVSNEVDWNGCCGAVDVWTGRLSGWTTTTNTTSSIGSNTNFTTWVSVAAGDINADGIKDVIIGDQGANSNAGAVYIAKGVSTGPTGDPGTTSYQINGANAGDNAGSSVAAMDFNNDGKTDVVLASPGASPNGVSGAGSVYVLWGSKNFQSTINLSDIQ